MDFTGIFVILAIFLGIPIVVIFAVFLMALMATAIYEIYEYVTSQMDKRVNKRKDK